MASRRIGKRRVLAGDREQVGGPLALLPQRRAPVGPALGSSSARAAHSRNREANIAVPGSCDDDQLVDLVGVDEQLVVGQLVDRLGQADHDAVVAPHELDRHAPPLAEAVLEGHGPRRVHLGAERREHADPPVADLVAEPLDHDRAVVGHHAGGLGLLVEVGDEVGGGPLVEAAVAEPLRSGRRPGRRRGARGRTRRWRGPSSSGRPGPSPCQNGIFPGCPGAGVTITFWKVMSSMRQVEAPSRNVSPGRLS